MKPLTRILLALAIMLGMQPTAEAGPLANFRAWRAQRVAQRITNRASRCQSRATQAAYAAGSYRTPVAARQPTPRPYAAIVVAQPSGGSSGFAAPSGYGSTGGAPRYQPVTSEAPPVPFFSPVFEVPSQAPKTCPVGRPCVSEAGDDDEEVAFVCKAVDPASVWLTCKAKPEEPALLALR